MTSASRSASPCPMARSSHSGLVFTPLPAAGGAVAVSAIRRAPSAATSPSMPRPTSSAAASGGYSPVIRPLVQGHDAVGQRVDLIELGGDQQDPSAGGLLLQDLRSRRTRSRRRRARVWAARRARASGRSRAPARGSASAGCRRTACRGDVDAPRTDVEQPDQLRGELLDPSERQDAEPVENGGSSCRPRTAFSQRVMSRTSPCSWRSSGMNPTPALRISCTVPSAIEIFAVEQDPAGVEAAADP